MSHRHEFKGNRRNTNLNTGVAKHVVCVHLASHLPAKVLYSRKAEQRSAKQWLVLTLSFYTHLKHDSARPL